MNDRWFFVNPTLPTLLSIGIIGILFSFFLWLELKKSIRFLPLRLIALTLMMLALLAILLRPSFLSSRSDSIALLTPGYDPTTVDSIVNERQISLLHLHGAKAYKNSEVISPQGFASIAGEIDFIFGQGLPPDELDLLQNKKYQFFPAAYPTGIISLSMPDLVFQDRKNMIEGVYNNAAPKTKIFLEGPGGMEDSVSVGNKAGTPFLLAFTPRTPGNILYRLIIRDSTGKQTPEILPVSVREHVPSNILFVQGYPSFETQYLKTFLGRRHRLLLRYQLSQNVYRYEAINRKLQPIGKFSDVALRTFDLLMIDTDALRALTRSEISVLQRAVKNGLGMIILFSNNPQAIRQVRSFLPVEFDNTTSDTAHVQIANQKKIFSAWPIAVKRGTFIQGVTKNKSRILSGYCYDGFGKVGFQLLQETYHLVLEGDSSGYGTIWSGLVEQTSRASKTAYSIKLSGPFPRYADEPLTVNEISSGRPPEILSDGIKIAPLENLYVDDVWQAKSWAGEPGWHRLTLARDSSSYDYYVSGKNEWEPLRIANTMRQTALSNTPDPPEKGFTQTRKGVSPLIFYLILLISAGLLWLAPKL